MTAARWAGVVVLVLTSQPVMATADGPDRWRVTGVPATDVLKMHAAPSSRSRVVTGIPSDAKGLGNLGCRGVPTYVRSEEMSAAERKRSGQARWCRVSYAGKAGWVAGRFLTEGGEAAASGSGAVLNGSQVGQWTLLCAKGSCWIEQLTMSAPKATLLRIDPDKAQNGRIVIERLGLPRQGTMTIELDGVVNSSGPIAPFIDKDGRRIAMEPDDITLGLLRAMTKAKTMTLRLEGEAMPAVFDIQELASALSGLKRLGGR